MVSPIRNVISKSSTLTASKLHTSQLTPQRRESGLYHEYDEIGYENHQECPRIGEGELFPDRDDHQNKGPQPEDVVFAEERGHDIGISHLLQEYLIGRGLVPKPIDEIKDSFEKEGEIGEGHEMDGG